MSPAEPPDTAARAAEDQWVESELVRGILRNSQDIQWASGLAVAMAAGVLLGEASPLGLALWTALAVLVVLGRIVAIRHYGRHVETTDAAGRLGYFERVRHLWTLSALLWGSLVALFLDRTSLSTQFLCWLILAGVAIFGINTLAPYLRAARDFAHSLCLPAVAVIGWQALAAREFDGPYYHFWLMVLVLIFWQLLLQVARRSNATHRLNFELQYRNAELIKTLTRQTQTAFEAVEIKNRFLASATHDIRQPVHALALYADWLASEPDLAGEIAPRIVQSTKAVNALFDSLFDLVRLDSGKIRLNLDEVDLSRLLSDLEVQYRPLAASKGLRLKVHHRRGLGVVMSDALLLKRIVGNLISNAIKYTERGGVLVGVRHSGGVARIEIWDTGVGIAPVHQRDIFREFYKVPIHDGTEDGFGLGLYIVSRLAHILGHPVELASRPGHGTVFRLVLRPADPAQAAQRAAAYDQLARRP